MLLLLANWGIPGAPPPPILAPGPPIGVMFDQEELRRKLQVDEEEFLLILSALS